MRIKDIMLITDQNYAMPTMVCVKSIIDHYKEDELITVHICSFELSETTKDDFRRLSTKNVRVIINFFSMDERIKQIQQNSHVTTSALIKFELANYFTEISAALYLDGDIVIKGEITDLLNFDLGTNYLAASYEFWMHINNSRYLFPWHQERKFYFNSGVMLLNFSEMRKDRIPEKMWDYKLNRTKTSLMDQECFNAICGDNAMHLSILWNLNPVFAKRQYLREINKIYKEDFPSVYSLISKAKIIHYVGKSEKPWKYSSAPLRRYWSEPYMKLYENEIEDLKIDSEQKDKYNPMREIYNVHGIEGIICFGIYKITHLFRGYECRLML